MYPKPYSIYLRGTKVVRMQLRGALLADAFTGMSPKLASYSGPYNKYPSTGMRALDSLATFQLAP